MIGEGNVVLGFMPNHFHDERVAEYGAFAAATGRSTASACATYPNSLARLAAVP